MQALEATCFPETRGQVPAALQIHQMLVGLWLYIDRKYLSLNEFIYVGSK